MGKLINGMENSCLTFVTPTLVAGDRSEVDVAAHEISHVCSHSFGIARCVADCSPGSETVSDVLLGRTSGSMRWVLRWHRYHN